MRNDITPAATTTGYGDAVHTGCNLLAALRPGQEPLGPPPMAWRAGDPYPIGRRLSTDIATVLRSSCDRNALLRSCDEFPAYGFDLPPPVPAPHPRPARHSGPDDP